MFVRIIIIKKIYIAIQSLSVYHPGVNFGRLPELDHRATVGPTLATKVWFRCHCMTNCRPNYGPDSN